MSLLRAAATVSSLTLLSRITGLVRDVMIARAFGASALTDAFWVAFRIPNLLRRLFAEGAFAQAFVPILGQARNQHEPEAVKQLLDRVARTLFLALCLITLLGILGAPLVVAAMASGLTEASRSGDFEAAIWMTRLMFPYIICMSLVAFASGVLNTWRHFAVPAITPALLNLSMIGTSLLFSGSFSRPIYALAAGVMLGGVAQFAVQWWALSRLNLRPRLIGPVRPALQDPLVRRIMRQMLPATLGVSVAQISLLINTNIATWLVAGSVSWLSFADRLMEFPTALVGVALGTVLLPSLTRAHADQDTNRYSALLDWGLRLMLLLGLPAALCMIMLADALVATLFHYGAFSAADVQQTRLAVMAYSVGLVGLLSIKILAPGFYAKQDIRSPVKIAIVVLLFTQLLNLVLVPWLAHAGLALAIGLGACLNAVALLIGLRRKGIYQPASGWVRFLFQQGLALTAMAAPLWWASRSIDWLGLQGTPFVRIAALGAVFFVAGMVYLGVLAATGLLPRHFRQAPATNTIGKTDA
jgi:putative peptidoglycan lipid II flippase